MTHVHSTITDLPLSCKSAAEHIARELEKEDAYANLTKDCCRQITDLEKSIEQKTGEKVALVAYRI